MASLTTSNELLQCPITLDMFTDPVLAKDGYTYERKAIEQWIRNHGTSPMTCEPLAIEQLFPNRAVKELVGSFQSLLREKNYQFTLGVDVQKKKERPIFQTSEKIIYAAEWLPVMNNRPEIVLLQIDGARTNKEASFYVDLSRHPHVVRTFGVVYDGDIPDQNNTCLLLQEYAPEGSLSELLQDRSTSPSEEILIQIFFQIIDGMIYLASNGVVHGDLSCRNIRVFRFDEKEPEKIVVKITDFGLSQGSQLYSVLPDATKTTLNNIPARYAAPEVLSSNETSEKSDVYSMGILMWEAYSRSVLPWAMIEDDNDVIEKVKNGETLPQPSNCSERYWSIIKKTWSKSPNDRPTFTALKHLFSEEYDNHSSKLQHQNEQSTLIEEEKENDSSSDDFDDSESTSMSISNTLYVGDLHPDVTETMLFNKFSSVGPLSHIHVCRDSITRRALGYAYVHFERRTDAKRALDTMNYDLLQGRPLRLMWPQRDPTLRKSNIGNVFIKNLDTNIDNKSLYNTFSTFGTILSCKIATDEHGESKGFGFVHFESETSADRAIAKMNGVLFGKKNVSVGRFMSRTERAVENDRPKKFTNIFIKNFGDQLDEDKLRELFSQYGKITSCKIEVDEDGQSKGFGFCSYENSDEAEAAVRNLNGHTIGDKQLYVGRFLKKSQHLFEIKRERDLQREERMKKYHGVNVYIKNLDDTIDDERLRKEFAKFGTITSSKVMSENGRSKGFGFVCFSSSDEATKAVNQMNGTVIGTKIVFVTLAQRKEERRVHLMNERMQHLSTAFAGKRPLQPQNYYPPANVQAYRPTPYRLGPRTPFASPQMLVRMQIPQTYFYTHTARNLPLQQINATMYPGQQLLTSTELANATPQEQKQMLGERLFPLIHQIQPDLAGKITGMLLEIDNTELLHILESPELLKGKVGEAIAVLQSHQAKQIHGAHETLKDHSTLKEKQNK